MAATRYTVNCELTMSETFYFGFFGRKDLIVLERGQRKLTAFKTSTVVQESSRNHQGGENIQQGGSGYLCLFPICMLSPLLLKLASPLVQPAALYVQTTDIQGAGKLDQ